MLCLIVTTNPLLRDSLRMAITGIIETDIATAKDCARAHDLMLERVPDVALIDGRLPTDEVLDLVQEMAKLAPGASSAVLLDGGAHARREELAAAGANILSVYTQPAAEFFDALARFIQEAGRRGDPTDNSG